MPDSRVRERIDGYREPANLSSHQSARWRATKTSAVIRSDAIGAEVLFGCLRWAPFDDNMEWAKRCGLLLETHFVHAGW
jgi:hypothetical protein